MRKHLLTFLFLIILGTFFSLVDKTQAATIFWDGGGSDELWSTANNWSGNYVPNATDTVVFSASSTKSVTINQNVTVQGININSTYSTGTISQGTSTVILSSNGFTMASGTWIGGSGMIDINDSSFALSGGYFSAPSSSATFTTSTLFIERDFTISGGTFSAANVTSTFDGADNADDSTITCEGTMSGTMKIDKTGFSSSFVTIASGCAVNLGANSTVTLGAGDFTNNGTINASGTLTINNTDASGSIYTFTNNGTITHTGTSWDINDFFFVASGTINYSGTQINIERDLTFNTTSSFVGKTITLDGTLITDDSDVRCLQPITGSLTVNKSNNGARTIFFSDCTIQGDFTRTIGPITSSSTSPLTTLTLHGNFSATSTRELGNSSTTLVFASSGIQYASSTGVPWGGPIQVNTSSTGELRLSSNFITSSTCSVGGVFNLNSRNFTCGSTFTVQGNGILKLQGAETVTAPTLSSSSTLVFTGDGDSASDSYTITTYATSTHHLIVSSTDTGDTFLIALPLDVNGNLQFATGTIQSSTTISIAGNWTNTNGTFSSGTSTVIFDGTGTSVISGTSTFYNLQSVTAGKTLNFAAGQTQTVTSTLTLTGSSGNPVTLRSTTDGTSWLLNAVAASVSYVDVKDSTNSGTSISCDSTCTNSGNNSGWTFLAASSGGGGGGGGGSSPQSPSSGSFSVSINGGDSTTTSTKVFLTFVGGSDSVYIDFGEDSTFSSNSYTREFYHMDRVYPYTLKSGGVRTIYGRFFTSNLTNPTQTFSDSITYIPASSPVATSSLPQAPVSTSTPPSLPLPSFVFTTPLYLGLESDDVRSLQSFLAKDPSLYPQGLITGFFGPLTKAAVGRFQCRYTILCDSNDFAYGYVGPKTRAKLNELINQSNDPKILQETIKILQRQVEELMKLLLQR